MGSTTSQLELDPLSIHPIFCVFFAALQSLSTEQIFSEMQLGGQMGGWGEGAIASQSTFISHLKAAQLP